MDPKKILEINKKFEDFHKKIMGKKAQNKCAHPQCEDAAINSHTISKEFSLRNLSIDGFVYSPASKRVKNQDAKEINFQKMGVNEATTFKGFCIKHDSIFKSLDAEGIKTVHDVFLQAFRSVNKFIFTNNAVVTCSEKVVGFNIFSDFSDKINSVGAVQLSELLLDFAANNIGKDGVVPLGRTLIMQPFVEQDKFLNLTLIYKKVRFKIPASIETRFLISLDAQIYENFFILVPDGENSSILVLCNPVVSARFEKFLFRDIDILNLAESALMTSSDFALSPSVVELWSPEKKKFIEFDYYFYYERKFLQPYDVSLFDALRQQLLAELSEEERNKELQKISELTFRPSYEERLKEFERRLGIQ